ncbi:MAG: spore germination protein [bacterium]|nr:spore germination protein [bacterium]
MNQYEVHADIERNKKVFEEIFSDCADIKMVQMQLGASRQIRCMIAYIEVVAGTFSFGESMIGKLLTSLSDKNEEEIYRILQTNGQGMTDVAAFDNLLDAAQGLLTGDMILFVDGLAKVLKIPDEGYPGMGVQPAESEKVTRGSNEGFSDSVKTNTALIRKRLRSLNLKNVEQKLGERTNTLVNIMYMDGIIRREVLDEVLERLKLFSIDGVLDTGMIEQLTEKQWYSPFPQFQTTERPDKAVQALLNGRVVLLSDNSPLALILPTDCNSFMQASDDYYNRFAIVSLERIIRYLAAFFALSLPGLYMAVINYHTSLLPTSLLLAFAEARVGVPFSSLGELLLMELSFELLREAGVRLPGTMGNTIGIVGGLIIGTAAVDAGLASPVVVIVVSFTALCSFAIPSEEFATAFRLLKFGLIFLGAWLGILGYLFGGLAILIHLSHLRSFGVPYLMPFVATDANQGVSKKDSILRLPLFMLVHRPVYARENEKRRFHWKHPAKGKQKK